MTFNIETTDDLIANFDALILEYQMLNITQKQFYSYQYLSPALYNNELRRIERAEKLRAKHMQDRALEVVYICGESGSGKTTTGKWLAQQYGFDYFVSGTGADVLDGYDMQKCIILDDFRAGNMKFSELLKFCDNNTGSTIASRYHNKDINNCKLMIITNCNKPQELYSMFSEDAESENEPAKQFYRRINYRYFRINPYSDDVEVYQLDESGNGNEIKTNQVLVNMGKVYEDLGIVLESKKQSLLDSLIYCKEPEEHNVGIQRRARGDIF